MSILCNLLTILTMLATVSAAKAATTNTARLDPKQSEILMTALDDGQKLGPGDQVSYRVLEDQDEAKVLTMTDSGDLDVPYFGLVRVMGKTSRQAAKEIKAVLERDHYYQATVILALGLVNKTRTNGRFYVTGQIRQAGSYEIPSSQRITVSKAILLAGGFSDFSDRKNVRLIRKSNGESKTTTVNVTEIWERGKIDADPEIQADDLIVVPAKLVNF